MSVFEPSLADFPCRDCPTRIGKSCIRPCQEPLEWFEKFEASQRENLKHLVRYSNYVPTMKTLENYINKEILGKKETTPE